MGPAVVKPGRASAPLVIGADAYRRLGAALGVSGAGTTYKVLVLVLRLNQLVAVLLRNLTRLSDLGIKLALNLSTLSLRSFGGQVQVLLRLLDWA